MNQTLDPLVIATTLASIIFSPAIAAVIGPYTVIVVASILGAAIGLGRREEQTTRFRAFTFYLRMAGLAMLLTVPLAAIAHSYLGLPESRWFLAPVATMIGIFGNNWRHLGPWFLRFIQHSLSFFRKGGEQ